MEEVGDDQHNKRPSLVSVASQPAKKGTLRKKNSIYFKQGFMPDFKQKTDLREAVKQKMSKPGTLRETRMKSVYSKKGSLFNTLGSKKSMYTQGTLEHRLNSMMDIAYMEFQGDVPDEEEVEKEKTEKEKHKEKYKLLCEAKAITKFRKKCLERAEKELGDFYANAEAELDSIEGSFGVDPESLKRLEVKIRDTIKARAEHEAAEEAAKNAPAAKPEAVSKVETGVSAPAAEPEVKADIPTPAPAEAKVDIPTPALAEAKVDIPTPAPAEAKVDMPPPSKPEQTDAEIAVKDI